MSNPLVFQFSLDPAETVRASRVIQRRGWFGWVSRAVWPLLVLLTVLYLISGASLQELWRLGLVAIILAVLSFGSPMLQRWQLRRAYNNTPNLRGPQKYQLSDAGVQITGGAGNVSLGWESFVEVAETDEVFLLFYSKRCAYYLPKRAVPSPTDIQAVRDLLRKHVGARAVRPDTHRAAPA